MFLNLHLATLLRRSCSSLVWQCLFCTSCLLTYKQSSEGNIDQEEARGYCRHGNQGGAINVNC